MSNKFTGLVVVRRVLGGYLAHQKISVRDAPVPVFSRSERRPKVQPELIQLPIPTQAQIRVSPGHNLRIWGGGGGSPS